jgi:general secretion pathway protein A
MGKTTILRAALQSHGCRDIDAGYIANSAAASESLVGMLLATLRRPELGRPEATPMEMLRAVLSDRLSHGRSTGLVLDEAESIGDDRFEELSALITLHEGGVQLLPIVLGGQRSVRARLARTPLRQFITQDAVYELDPLDLDETASYILWRAKAAGGEGSGLFTREAVIRIHELSGGVPRTISVICDNALLLSFRHRRKPVTRGIVNEVAVRLDLDVISDGSSSEVPHPQPGPRPALA